MGVMIGQKYDPKLNVMNDSKGDINQRRFRYQELMDLLDGIVFGIERVIGKVGNPMKTVSNDEAVNMTSIPSVELIKTSIYRKQEEVFHTPTLALKYGFRKTYQFMHTTHVPIFLSLSICPYSIHGWGGGSMCCIWPRVCPNLRWYPIYALGIAFTVNGTSATNSFFICDFFGNLYQIF